MVHPLVKIPAIVLALSFTSLAEPVFGPAICVDAQNWKTPGWQQRDGDYAYAQSAEALKDIPADRRMLRASSVAAMERIVQQTKVAALGYVVEGAKSDLSGAGALARRYSLKLMVSLPWKDAERQGERAAGLANLLSVGPGGTIEERRRVFQKILAANSGVVLMEEVPARSALREYRGNADLVRGILVSGPDAGPLLRAIRPQLGLPNAVAPGEGPSMYFFNFLWKTPGWQPRKGDYAFVKLRPALKTLQQKVDYVLAELKDIPPEHRKIMANGLAGVEELLHELIDVRHFQIAALDYDIEGWELTPQEEKDDPIAACKRGQALADKYKMAYVVVPDIAMGKYAVQVAPFVKGLAPQCKGTQVKSIDQAIVRQRKLYADIRRANPDILLYHDLGAAPQGVLQTVEGLLRYYAGVADLVDGIEIWSQDVPDQRAVIGKYIVSVRPPVR